MTGQLIYNTMLILFYDTSAVNDDGNGGEESSTPNTPTTPSTPTSLDKQPATSSEQRHSDVIEALKHSKVPDLEENMQVTITE